MTKSTAPKSMTSGRKSIAPFGKDVMPTNAAKLGTLSKVLSAIKHIGRPASGGSKPFAK